MTLLGSDRLSHKQPARMPRHPRCPIRHLFRFTGATSPKDVQRGTQPGQPAAAASDDIHAHTYTYTYKYKYVRAPPPPRTTARCRDSATNAPTFNLLVYDPGLTLVFEVPRRQHMYIGRSLHSEFLRPFTQTLREMISPTMKVICQSSLQCSPKSKPQQYV